MPILYLNLIKYLNIQYPISKIVLGYKKSDPINIYLSRLGRSGNIRTHFYPYTSGLDQAKKYLYVFFLLIQIRSNPATGPYFLARTCQVET